MPTVLRKDGFRFFFYSNDHLPVHIHVEKENKTAKFYLEPVALVRSKKFTASEIKQMRRLVEENKIFFKEKFYEYFNG